MDRRRFLKWFGIASAAPIAVGASAKFDATAKALDVPAIPASKPMPLPGGVTYGPYDGDCASAIVMSSCMVSVPVVYTKRRAKQFVSKG